MSVWFEDWNSLLKILVSSVAGYYMLIVYFRLAGKRATSRMNNFDWIVTVAIGSIFASMIVLRNVPITDGLLAMALLVGLQYLLTLSTSRWEWARRLFLARASLLYLKGEFVEDEMLRQRISREEMLSAVRESGVGSWDEVEAITLEPDAELAVVKRTDDDGTVATVTSVSGYEPKH